MILFKKIFLRLTELCPYLLTANHDEVIVWFCGVLSRHDSAAEPGNSIFCPNKIIQNGHEHYKSPSRAGAGQTRPNVGLNASRREWQIIRWHFSSEVVQKFTCILFLDSDLRTELLHRRNFHDGEFFNNNLFLLTSVEKINFLVSHKYFSPLYRDNLEGNYFLVSSIDVLVFFFFYYYYAGYVII